VSRIAGGLRGFISNWFVSRNNAWSVKAEWEMIADRAEDIAVIDPHAASSIDSISTSTVGTGLVPQSRPNAKILGWEQDQVRGVSILAPAMKFFRDLNDYLDYELVGAIVAASFPVFIETVDPMGVWRPDFQAGTGRTARRTSTRRPPRAR
jgi:hypothetical protein